MANERRLIDSAELISMLPIVEVDKQISLIGAVADVVTMISNCTPVDAVEVRCKDCIHMTIEQGLRYCNAWGRFNGAGDDGYCNYGAKRKSGAQTQREDV